MAAKNIRNFELKLRKTGLMVLIAGMALLLCGVFILGVEVGKGLDAYPEKISSLPKKIFAIISKPSRIDPVQDITEHEKDIDGVSDTDGAVYKDDKNSSEQLKSAEGQDNVEDSDKIATIIAADKNEKQNTVLVAKAKETQVNKKVISKYMVHAASYQQKEKAYLLNKKIAGLGYEPKVIPVQIKNQGTWYRVVVPGFVSKEKANIAAQKISAKTGADCLVRAADASNR